MNGHTCRLLGSTVILTLLTYYRASVVHSQERAEHTIASPNNLESLYADPLRGPDATWLRRQTDENEKMMRVQKGRTPTNSDIARATRGTRRLPYEDKSRPSSGFPRLSERLDSCFRALIGPISNTLDPRRPTLAPLASSSFPSALQASSCLFMSGGDMYINTRGEAGRVIQRIPTSSLLR
jgi:hypothetical protein